MSIVLMTTHKLCNTGHTMKQFEANNMDFIFDAVFNGAINLAIELLVTQRYFISFLIVG